MIYISSSCVKHKKIKDSILELVHYDFKNIELSGGTEYYDGFLDDLLELKEKYDLNYLCHNYFPPPKEHFVLNLASLNNEIYEKTLSHLIDSIALSKKLGTKKFGFHAGFFVDIKPSEIGKKISKNPLYDKEKAIERFCKGYKILKQDANDVKLYIENNVFSYENSQTFNGENIFMLCSAKECAKLKEMIDFELLLDIAHLKVSSRTLGLNFEEELAILSQDCDYYHISDNDGLSDQNLPLRSTQALEILGNKNSVDITVEIYAGMAEIYDDFQKIHGIVNAK